MTPPGQPLPQTLDLLRATLDACADGIVAVSHTGGPALHNARYCEMWRVPAELLAPGREADLLAHSAAQTLQPQAFLARVEALRARPDEEACDLIELRDGRLIERHVVPQRQGGVVTGVVLTFRDETERVRAVRDARRQQATLLSMINSVPEIVFYKDADGRYLGCNDAFASLVGRAPADVVGCTVHDLFDATTAADLAARDKAVMFSLNKRTAETWATRADGRRVLYETVTSPEGRLPLLAPMSATVGIFAFLYAWNDFMMPSLIISDPALQTLPVRQNLFQTQFSNNYNVSFASYLMAMAPAIIVYLFSQRWVMSGSLAWPLSQIRKWFFFVELTSVMCRLHASAVLMSAGSMV